MMFPTIMNPLNLDKKAQNYHKIADYSEMNVGLFPLSLVFHCAWCLRVFKDGMRNILTTSKGRLGVSHQYAEHQKIKSARICPFRDQRY